MRHKSDEAIGIGDGGFDHGPVGMVKFGCRLQLHQDGRDFTQRLSPLMGNHAEHHPHPCQTGLMKHGTLFFLRFYQGIADACFEVFVHVLQEGFFAADPLPVATKHRIDLAGYHDREESDPHNDYERDEYHKADVFVHALFKFMLFLSDGLLDIIHIKTGADHPAVSRIETKKSDLSRTFSGVWFDPIILDEDSFGMLQSLIDKFSGDVGAFGVPEIDIVCIDTAGAEWMGTQIIIGIVDPYVAVLTIADTLDIADQCLFVEMRMVLEVVDHGGDFPLEYLFLAGDVFLLDVSALLDKITLLGRDKNIDGRKSDQQYRHDRGEDDKTGNIFFAKHYMAHHTSFWIYHCKYSKNLIFS